MKLVSLSPMNPIKPLEQSSDDSLSAMESTNFGDILSQFEAEHAEVENDSAPLQGTVVSLDDNVVLVDIGRKMEGVIPADRLRHPDGTAAVAVGDKITVMVAGRNEQGQYNLTTQKIAQPKDWSSFQQALDDKAIVTGRVSEQIKGGFRVEVSGVKAFMPASRSGVRDMNDMPKLVGQDIEVRIIKLDTDKEDVVVDRRSVLEEVEKQSKDAAFHALSEGQVLNGTVRNLTDYGAFLDLGGVDGMLHVADISWNRIGKPADVLTVGDVVEVKILKINVNTRKVSLGMKQLIPDPWSLVAEKYKPGERVSGKVVRLTDFGAFVELEPGIDGMIHVSELSWSRKIRKPADAVSVGDQVETVVLEVKPVEKRIALGLKQALGDPWADVEKKFPIGSVVEAPVTNLAQFGAFVDLGDGFEGLIHIGDITREKRLNHPKEMINVGQTVKAQITEIDRERRRIRLSMKQLEPTPFDHFLNDHKVGDVLTGRVLEANASRARLEIGDGVVAVLKLAAPAEPAATKEAEESRTDIASMTAALAARWKSGGSLNEKEKSKDTMRGGQLKQVRIISVDPESRRIEVELAE